MAELRRVPPGRAGRPWLAHRRRIAERGVALLDRKQRILRTEQERFHLIEQSAREQWRLAAMRAGQWLQRAAVLGGQRELRFASPSEPARVHLTWSTVMGVRYPSAAVCLLPEASPGMRSPGSSALDLAIAAHREALVAAAAYATAAAAREVIDAEAAETRRRLTALTERWLPKLERAQQALRWRLEEEERSGLARLHAFGRGEPS